MLPPDVLAEQPLLSPDLEELFAKGSPSAQGALGLQMEEEELLRSLGLEDAMAPVDVGAPSEHQKPPKASESRASRRHHVNSKHAPHSPHARASAHKSPPPKLSRLPHQRERAHTPLDIDPVSVVQVIIIISAFTVAIRGFLSVMHRAYGGCPFPSLWSKVLGGPAPPSDAGHKPRRRGQRSRRMHPRALAMLRAVTWMLPRAMHEGERNRRKTSDADVEQDERQALLDQTTAAGGERAAQPSTGAVAAGGFMPAIKRVVSERLLPRFLGSGSDPPALISPAQLRWLVAEVLPRRLGIKDMRLLYSTEQHGCSLRTAFHLIEGKGPCVVIVLDVNGHIFGAFCSEPPQPLAQYQGSGESCLFTVHPNQRVYRWSHSNALFFIGGPHFMGFGSGPAYGLYLDDSFENGSSGASDTYHNDCLASAVDFRVVKVEIWGFE